MPMRKRFPSHGSYIAVSLSLFAVENLFSLLKQCAGELPSLWFIIIVLRKRALVVQIVDVIKRVLYAVVVECLQRDFFKCILVVFEKGTAKVGRTKLTRVIVAHQIVVQGNLQESTLRSQLGRYLRSLLLDNFNTSIDALRINENVVENGMLWPCLVMDTTDITLTIEAVDRRMK